MLEGQEEKNENFRRLIRSINDSSDKPLTLKEELQEIFKRASQNPDIPYLDEMTQLFQEKCLQISIMDRLPRSVNPFLDKSSVAPELKKTPIDRKSDARIYDEEKLCCECQRSQIRQFGVNAWKEGYDRIVSILFDEYDDNFNSTSGLATRKERVDHIRDLVTRRSPQMETIQSLFTDEREVVVKKNKNYGSESDIQASLISPRCIPDKFVEDLHLVDFSDCKGNPFARLEKKADPATISAIKMIFTAMKALRGGREFILRQVDLESVRWWPDLFQKLSMYNHYCPGAILVVSEQKNIPVLKECDGGFVFRRCKASYYPDAASRIRAGHYMQDGYSNEREQLAALTQKVARMGEMLSDWKANTPALEKEQLRNNLIEFTADLRETLKYARDVRKVDVSELCEKISSREDLQKNPMACLLILTKVVKEFHKRLDEANYKEGAKLRDANNIGFLASKARTAFNELEKEVENSHNFHQLRWTIGSLSQIEIAPYNTFAKAVMGQYATYGKDAEAQSEAFKRIQFTVGLYRVNELLDTLLQGSYIAANWQKKFNETHKLYKEMVKKVSGDAPIFAPEVYERMNKFDESLLTVQTTVKADGAQLKGMRDTLKKVDHVAGILDIVRAMH